MRFPTLLIVAVLCLTAFVLADDPCNGNDYGTAGDFDYYVVAQSWPAQFCQDHSSWPGCSNPTNWQQHNLTLHGVWPNYAQSQDGHEYPQCCQSQYGQDVDPAVVSELLSDLQTYWPNEQDPSGSNLNASLWEHEWGKHGTCSGLDQKTYFQNAMGIEVALATPSAITSNIGNSLQMSDLYAAYGASSCTDGGDCIVAFNCQNQNGQAYLTQVTTCWSKDFTQQTCPSSITTEGDQCGSGAVYIQSF